MAAWQPVGESADCHKIQQNQSFIRDTNSVFGRLENNGLRPEMGHSSVPEKENPDALAGAVGADLHGSSVAADDSLKRIEAARALAAAVSDCDPRDRAPLLKRLLDYHIGIDRGFFLGPGDWS